MRGVISVDGIRSLECTLATTTSSRASNDGFWSSEPSSRMSTSMPVRMRNGAASSRRFVELGDDVELLLEPFGRQAVGDGEPRRMVGEHDVFVPDVARRQSHLADRRAAVGPVRVRVAVTAQRCAQRRRRRVDRRVFGRLQAAQVDRLLAAQRFGDAPRGHLADALAARSACRRRARVASSSGRQLLDRVGRGAERLHPVGRLARPFEQEGDLPQVGDRVPSA